MSTNSSSSFANTYVAIDIRGAKGPNAISVNGVYEPTEEICNRFPVYRKRGEQDKWLEFFDISNKWYIKATTDRGKARGWMRLSANPPCRPELCKGSCEVWDGSKWTSQSTVSIVTLKQRREDDKKRGIERRLQAIPVDIRGATGPSASSINGIYEVTNELCGGWPVYRKKGDADKWLEFIVATSEWYVKPTADRGRPEGWMCIPADPPNRPELCTHVCDVWDGERWVIQDTVTVLKAVSGFDSMLDFRLFCEEELLGLQERLTGSLKRVVQSLSIPPDKIEEGTNYISDMLVQTQIRVENLRKDVLERGDDKVDNIVDKDSQSKSSDGITAD